VAPGLGPLRVLHYGRVRLAPHAPPVRVDPGRYETALVCLGGSGVIRAGTERFHVSPYDLVYVPREVHFMVAGGVAGIDVAEVSAPVDERYPLQYVPYQADRPIDASAHRLRLATSSSARVLLGEAGSTGRLIVGLAAGEPLTPPAITRLASVDVDVACLYVRLPEGTSSVHIECDGANAMTGDPIVHAGDVVLGPHRWRAGDLTPDAALGMLWMLGTVHESADRRAASAAAAAAAK
jgi:hypothetical protein